MGLRAAMKAEKIKAVPSGEKFFATCKHIGYKNVLKTFKSARTLMSPECGLPGLDGGRSRRSLDLLPALLLAGSYDPSSIWFQYFLCKDIDLYCYFFTQGWTQGQYGQYYLYDNLLDDTTGLFAGSTDSNLATIALLGGLGGGIGQPVGIILHMVLTQHKFKGGGVVQQKQHVVMRMIRCLTALLVGSAVKGNRRMKKKGSLTALVGSAVKRKRKKKGSVVEHQDVVMWMILCLTAVLVGSAVKGNRMGKMKKKG